eukprot:gene22317-28901_t
MTLSRFMIEATRSNEDHADLESLIESIQLACKTISNLVSRSGITDLTGLNISPMDLEDKQNSLYQLSNQVLKNSLRFTGKLGVLTAEDEDQPILIEEAWNSKYLAVFDPLDGASNIDIGIVTGTIFGIFKETNECLQDYGENISEETKSALLKSLQPSSNLVASGYCMYSSTTVLMLTLGDGVHSFTLDPTVGEFILTRPNIVIPKRGNIYSFNEGYMTEWNRGVVSYINDIKSGLGETKKKYSSRYIGSLVGDIHRTLLYGGIFGYPGTSHYPDGKLRFLHEVSPLAYLIEQAGGRASTGTKRILDMIPNQLNQHVPTFLGSYEDVLELEKYIRNEIKERK